MNTGEAQRHAKGDAAAEPWSADLDRLHRTICGTIVSVGLGLSSVPPTVAMFVDENLRGNAPKVRARWRRIVDLACDALDDAGVDETSFDAMSVRIAVRGACMRFAEERKAPHDAATVPDGTARVFEGAQWLAENDASPWDEQSRATLRLILEDITNAPFLLDLVGLSIDWTKVDGPISPALLWGAIESGCRALMRHHGFLVVAPSGAEA